MKTKKIAMATLIMTTLGSATLFAQTGIMKSTTTDAVVNVNARVQSARLSALRDAMVSEPTVMMNVLPEMPTRVASYATMGNGVEHYLRLMAAMPRQERVKPAVDLASRRLNSPRVAVEAAVLYASLPKIPLAVGPSEKN